MRRSAFSLVAALFVLALGARASRAELVVEKAVREISAVKALVNVRTQLTFRNDGDNDADAAVVCIEPALAGKLAFIEVTEGTDDDAPLLQAKVLQTPPSNAPEGTLCHSVALSRPLKKKSTTTFDVLNVFTKAQRPHPALIATGQQQRVVVSYSATVASPYVVESQRTVVRVPGRVESHENADGPPPEDDNGKDDDDGGSRSSNKPRTLTHSAFAGSARPPFSLSRGRVHYVNNAAFAHAERLVREVEVSHWGNVAVRERFAPLFNAGARHRGEWSRLDFSANAEATNPTALQSLLMVLPPGARWFHFRDEIGNISSSTVRAEPEFKVVRGKNGKKRKIRNEKKGTKPVEAALYPRYPLAGGWRASFEFGWSMPLRYLAAELTGDDKRTSLEREARGIPVSSSAAALSGKRVRLMLPSFFTPIRDIVADELSVVVVLPEGANRVAHYLPFDVDSAVLGKRATYLDTTGRTTLELRLANAVEDHGSPLVIEYSLPSWRPLVEPAMVVGAVAAVVSAVFLSSRVDLSLDAGSPSSSSPSSSESSAGAAAAAAAVGGGGGASASGDGDDQRKKKAKSVKAN